MLLLNLDLGAQTSLQTMLLEMKMKNIIQYYVMSFLQNDLASATKQFLTFSARHNPEIIIDLVFIKLFFFCTIKLFIVIFLPLCTKPGFFFLTMSPNYQCK